MVPSLRRHIGDVIGRYQAPAAGHVYADHRRISRNVAPEMPGEQPGTDVVARSGSVADDHLHLLAVIHSAGFCLEADRIEQDLQ